MISMGDRTFCSSPNCQNKCGRKLTDDLILLFTKQWGNENFPVAMANFCGDSSNDKTNDESEGSDRV